MKLLTSIHSYLHFCSTISQATEQSVKNSEQRIYCNLKRDELHRLASSTKEKGVSEQPLAEFPVVVSLTSYGKRIYEVYLVVESIMQGTVKPNRIILWLSKDLSAIPLPRMLEKQKDRGLEVKFYPGIDSYRKIIPSLRHYPDAIIVTIDDDMFYQPDMLEGLLLKHQEFNKDILAYRVDTIQLDANNKPLPYHQWKSFQKPSGLSPLNVAIGAEGILYPPHTFDNEVLNENVFMDICPTADDLWLKAMAMKAGIGVRHVYTHYERGGGAIPNWNVQDISLQQINEKNSFSWNDEQFRNVLTRYNLTF